jgi:hypothetical protein
MTNTELRYMEVVPRELKRIADALEKLNTLIEKSVGKLETEKE